MVRDKCYYHGDDRSTVGAVPSCNDRPCGVTVIPAVDRDLVEDPHRGLLVGEVTALSHAASQAGRFVDSIALEV